MGAAVSGYCRSPYPDLVRLPELPSAGWRHRIRGPSVSGENPAPLGKGPPLQTGPAVTAPGFCLDADFFDLLYSPLFYRALPGVNGTGHIRSHVPAHVDRVY